MPRLSFNVFLSVGISVPVRSDSDVKISSPGSALKSPIIITFLPFNESKMLCSVSTASVRFRRVVLSLLRRLGKCTTQTCSVSLPTIPLATRMSRVGRNPCSWLGMRTACHDRSEYTFGLYRSATLTPRVSGLLVMIYL